MMDNIAKENLKALFDLARLKPSSEQQKEEKLIEDISRILEHLAELQTVDTSLIKNSKGGKSEKNFFREDEINENLGNTEAINEFPENKNGYLKVLAVLEHKKKKA